MSVRRRAIRARMETEDKFLRQWRRQDDALKALLALVKRKIETGDKSITIEEINACMPTPTVPTSTTP